MTTTSELAGRLRRSVQQESKRLGSLSESDAESRYDGGEGWSPKQEIGHLLDSAVNNRVRFVVAALAGSYEGPTYDGEGWVELGGYEDSSWSDLVDLWVANNVMLAKTIERIPHERLSARCSVGSLEPVTLDFLIQDYILHMQHHLDHLLNRNKLTEYPGAAIGI